MPRILAWTIAMRCLARRASALIALAALALLAGCAMPFGSHPAPASHQGTATPAPLTWRQATLPEGFTPPGPANHFSGFDISPADGHIAWACAPNASAPGTFTLWVTHDAATTWQQVSTVTAQTAEAPQWCTLVADEYDPRTLVAYLGAGFQITPQFVSQLSTDGGAHWLSLPSHWHVGSTWTNNGVIYAAANDLSNPIDAGKLVTITTAGGTPSIHATNYRQASAQSFIWGLWMHPPDPTIFVAAGEGDFQRSDDGGAHWSALTTPQNVSVEQGRWLAASQRWLFCAPVAFQCSDDGGKTWQTVPASIGSSDAAHCTPEAGGMMADGSLLVGCPGAADASHPGWGALMRLAPGATSWRQIGSVANFHFTVTATGQIWAFAPEGGAPYVATLAG
jgi:hypothetical protein